MNFPELDHQVLKLWKDRDIQERSIREREGCPDYVTYDGPPGTNGQPHIGHMMQSALKDLWPKYYTMKGYRVLRKAGWDTHGLPIELTAEKELGLKTKRDILTYGVEKYIDYCLKTVYRYKDSWTNAIHRIGRFLDTDNYYATLTKDYIQTDWWVLKQAWEKGLLYKGHKIMPYCPRCGTSLSAHETAQGYKDVTDISLYAKFQVDGKKDTYFIAWTTTAWTLLSNIALAVNPDLIYVTVEAGEEKLIVAEARLEALRDMLGEYKVIGKQKGSDLKGLFYEPLWQFQLRGISSHSNVTVNDDKSMWRGNDKVFLKGRREYTYGSPRKIHTRFCSSIKQVLNRSKIHYYNTIKPEDVNFHISRGLLKCKLCEKIEDNSHFIKYKEQNSLEPFSTRVPDDSFRVVCDKYVTAEDGTGIVHLAPYGEDDFRLIRKNGLRIVQNVNEEGRCVRSTKFAGRLFSDSQLDIDILKDLAGKGLLFGKKKLEHSYPHCYRCDERLMYFATSSWFIRTSSFKDKMLAANEDINWYPNHIKNGRFGNWLENNVDWAISRSRYWGSPLPIWTCKKCGHQICVGSLKELEELKGEPLPDDFDPHKPYIDRFELPCRKCNSGVMMRVPDVLDSWFNAGLMPWGQWGYPAASGSKEVFDSQYPADFICEALDQTRGWFYTMLAISTMLTDKSSYKNVICTALIADEKGHKMSKSRGNVVDPMKLCDKYGADAVRLNFYTVNPWMSKRFKESALTDCLKQVMIPYWNAYSFFVTYARVDGWKPGMDTEETSHHMLDRWILSRLEWLRETIENSLDKYDVTSASNAFITFIDELTNWYIRRSRRRFWKSEDDQDKAAAYTTLYKVLCNFNRMLAPFLPFVTEAIFQNLERAYDMSAPDSVHLAMFPTGNPEARDIALEKVMGEAKEIVSIALSLRNEGNVRVRQPLQSITVLGMEVRPDQEIEGLILDELNVKQLQYTGDVSELYSLRAKADYKQLGPRLGKKLKDVVAVIAAFDNKTIEQFLEKGDIKISGEIINSTEILVEQVPREGYWVRTDRGLTVALNNQIDDLLRYEWLAREFVHYVQNMRKEADLEVTQRIKIRFSSNDEINEAVMKHKDYIKNETLAVSLDYTHNLNTGSAFQIGDQSGTIEIIP
ncbi:MAG: class I tRNA ligase family protein [Candidatus Hatepunaea meridiana]|nr:class I tRNA ligase family protein [Candidatus Hatepunaea meridiana]